MRVPCPNCEAVYQIPDGLMAGGSRRLRCARCAAEWQAGEAPAPVTAALTATAAPPPAAEPPPPAPAARGPRRGATPPTDRAARAAVRGKSGQPPAGLALGAAWAATALFVVGLGAGFYAWPDIVTDNFPPAARLYDALGIDVSESALSTSPAK